jgi:pilus assembly protein CpaE
MAELITADAIKRILGKLRECYDFVVVDTWPTFQDTVLAALDVSEHIILLFALEMPAIKNLKIFLEVADALEYPAEKLLLVLNRADGLGGIRLSDVEENLHHRVPIRLVSDGRLAVYALNRGVPFVMSNPESPLSQGIFRLSELLLGSGRPEIGAGGEPTMQGKNGNGIFGKVLAPMKIGLRRSTRMVPSPSR